MCTELQFSHYNTSHEWDYLLHHCIVVFTVVVHITESSMQGADVNDSRLMGSTLCALVEWLVSIGLDEGDKLISHC